MIIIIIIIIVSLRRPIGIPLWQIANTLLEVQHLSLIRTYRNAGTPKHSNIPRNVGLGILPRLSLEQNLGT